MGQVSILEDLEKAYESALACSGAGTFVPSEAQIRAHEKNLEVRYERVVEANRQIVSLYKIVKGGLSDKNMDTIKYALKIQDEVFSLRALRQEKDFLNKKMAAIRKEIALMQSEIEGIVDEGMKVGWKGFSQKDAYKLISAEIVRLRGENAKLREKLRR